jgi:hypothetical protein
VLDLVSVANPSVERIEGERGADAEEKPSITRDRVPSSGRRDLERAVGGRITVARSSRTASVPRFCSWLTSSWYVSVSVAPERRSSAIRFWSSTRARVRLAVSV